jgi:hypothetical protein
LVDCEAIAAWRAARAASERNAEVLVRVLAADVPEIVADAMHEAFRHVDGPHKRAVAGVLAGAWFLVSAAMLDRLRREVPELADLTVLPEKISTLRHICAASGSLAPSFSKE